MPFVYVKLPKTGLGNMLLVWARGIVFAKINDMECITSSWWGFRWGALVRREARKRLYWRYFNETSIVKQLSSKYFLKNYKVVVEPQVKKIEESSKSFKKVYLFNKVITESNIFEPLDGYQDYIKNMLLKNLHDSKKNILNKYSIPVIGVHIRRGDFKLGSTITPLEYFIDGIKKIRELVGTDLPVTVFTDASEEELENLMKLSNIKIAEKKPDILDIILLGQSKIMILSSTSTFSYWGAFLSDAIVLRHKSDWLAKIKSTNEQSNYTEIFWDSKDDSSNDLLKNKIALLKL